MVSDGSLEVLEILSEAASVIAEGEVAQLVTANDTETNEEDYLEVIRAKTAKLFAAACEIGAVVAERPKAEQEALETFGHNLGIAFQLVDDVLDYAAHQPTLGKTVGDDFREGKITLPIVLAFRAADEEQRTFWRRTLEDLEQKKGDFRRAAAMLEKSGALKATIERARGYGAVARQALEIFPASPEKAALLEAVEFAVERTY
jgi:octaprenyl-diphosphate synthase